MTPDELEKVQELGDIAFFLADKLVLQASAGQERRVARKEMQPYKQRLEELLTELGL